MSATAESGIGTKPTIKMIPADQLIAYPEVQRIPPTKESVNQIAANLDTSSLGTLSVSLRPDGSYSLMDGQRRVAALKMRGMGSYRCKCDLYTGLTVQQEAQKFLDLNSVRVVGSLDRFTVGVTAKLPECVAIVAALKSIGWRVGRAAGPGSAVAVESMLKVYRADKSGALLSKTLGILNDAFGRDKNTMSGSLIDGLGQFLRKNPAADAVSLTEKLRAKFSSPVTITAQARTRRETERGSLAQNVSAIIERTYSNRRARA